MPVAPVAWVVVPARVPVGVAVPLESVRLTLAPTIGLLSASRIWTVTAGVIVAPAVAPVGCWVKVMVLAAPAATVNWLLVTGEAAAVAVSWYCRPCPR